MLIKIAYSLFLANFTYGILAKSHIIDATRFRVMHHGLYFCVMVSIIAATVEEFLSGEFPLLLILMAGLLFGMTRFRGRTAQHWQYALFCFLTYSAILVYYF